MLALLRTFLMAFIILGCKFAHAQMLQIIGNDPVQGPLCAGPLGPGPCAQVQQFIATLAMPNTPQLPLQLPAAPFANQAQIAPVGSVQLSGTPQEIGIRCAKTSGNNVNLFAACAGSNVILPEREHAVLDCAVSSPTTQEFAICAAPNLGVDLSDDQKSVVNCAMQSNGDESDFLSCAGAAIAGSHLTVEQRAVVKCAADANGDASQFASCSATKILGAPASKEQRIAIECAAQSDGDATEFASCAGTKFLNMNLNPEQQIAIQCVASTGGQPYAAGGCIATRLTTRELEKCAQYGFGGEDGCFGDNNDLVGRNGWVARTFGQIAGGPNSVVNNPGQIFGGPNSVFNNPGQVFGGPNSVFNNPRQITGGPNSVMNNPGQIFGGPNSVFNNPGQIAGGSNSVINNPGQIFGGSNSVFNNPGQLLPHF